MTDKSVLRVSFGHIRSSLVRRDELSNKITEQILAGDHYRYADTIYAYYPIGSEVDVSGIITQAFIDNKKVALPKCLDKNGSMEFYYIDNLDGLNVGVYGIPEPSEERVARDYSGNSLCLVPGLSFDVHGYRLGYGGGYYDRFLSRFTGISVGLCYEACLVEELPVEPTDKKVDIIITDKNYLKIKEE